MIRLLQRLHQIESWLLTLMLAAMVLLGLTQILLRNLWQSGIGWGDPVVRLLVLWIAMAGAMRATREGRHISVDLLSRYLPESLQPLQQRVTSLIAGLICLPLSWHAGRFVIMEWQDETLLFGQLPAWMAELILPLGFAVMALRLLLQAVTGTRARESPPC